MRTLLAVHAHPDDETITTGGVLARAASEGTRVVVVTCTLGESGVSDATAPLQGELGSARADELARALARLGAHRSVLLGYRDSGMAGTPENHDPRSFDSAPLDEAAGRLAAVIRDERPSVVLTYDERGGYGHPDHVKVHAVTLRAVDLAADPAWRPRAAGAASQPWRVPRLYAVVFPRSYVQEFSDRLRAHGIDAPWTAPAGVEGVENAEAFGVPDARVTARVDVAQFAAVKRAALAEHRTQMPPTHWFMRMPPLLVSALWATEFFERLAPPPEPGAPPEDDLFSGVASD